MRATMYRFYLNEDEFRNNNMDFVPRQEDIYTYEDADGRRALIRYELRREEIPLYGDIDEMEVLMVIAHIQGETRAVIDIIEELLQRGWRML